MSRESVQFVEMVRQAAARQHKQQQEAVIVLPCPLCECETPHDIGVGDTMIVYRCQCCGNEQTYRKGGVR